MQNIRLPSQDKRNIFIQFMQTFPVNDIGDRVCSRVQFRVECEHGAKVLVLMPGLGFAFRGRMIDALQDCCQKLRQFDVFYIEHKN